jgi:sulfotransferase
MKTIVPLTGTPRSGSTLLMHILNQNPDFTVGADSSLPVVLNNIRSFVQDNTTTEQLPNKTFNDCVLKFCRSGSESWVNEICPTNIFLDKSRYWLYQYQFMFKVFPNIKMILNIRDLREIVNSVEKIHHNSLCMNFQNYYNGFEKDFLHQRVDNILDLWFIKESLVSLKELIEVAPKCRDNILIFRYENLLQEPQESMNRIYDFLKLPKFNHDFENIQDMTNHFDNIYLPYGNHKIRNKLERCDEDLPYLPQNFCYYIIETHKWYYEHFYPEILEGMVENDI